MPTFYFIISTACLLICGATLWAAFSEKVRDGLILKISLTMTSLSAYMAFTRPEERTFGMLIICVSLIVLAALFQKYIMKAGIWHHKPTVKPCSFHKTSRSQSSQKAPVQRARA